MELWDEAQAFIDRFKRESGDFHNNGQSPKTGIFRKMKKWLFITGGVCVVIGAIVATVSDYVKPWEVALKQTKSGANAGFEKTIYPGGVRYLLTPTQEEMFHFDTRIKFLHITTQVVYNPDGSYTITPGTGLHVPTTDGSTVFSDVTIAYRVYREPEYDEKGKMIHGGPNELRKKSGMASANWESVILQDAGDRCNRALGALKTDDYYNSPLREQKAEIAKSHLNNGWVGDDNVQYLGWHQYGIDVVDILIRAYYYTPVINTAIAAKNSQIQEKMLNDALGKKATKLAAVAKATGEGDAAIATLKNKKAREVEIILSRGNKYKTIQMSAGDRLVGEAEAGAQKLKAKALETPGSQLYVAKELAPLAKNLHGGVISGMDPFDMGQWMDRFVGKNSN